MMATYVNFNGACAEAFPYYREHLGGVLDSIATFGEMPDHSRVPDAWRDRVIHARMSVGGAVLMNAEVRRAALALPGVEEGKAVPAALCVAPLQMPLWSWLLVVGTN